MVLTLTLIAALTFLVTPLVACLAQDVGAVDRPNERRIHRGSIANWGGVSIAICTVSIFPLAAIPAIITGAIDGLKPLSAKLKLPAQLLSAWLVVGGFDVAAIAWIVLMMNALNLIDGADGLATGTGIILFLAIAVLVPASSFTALVMAAALIGFWWWNWHPATIFLGDSGSYLIGFMIGYLTLELPWSVRLALCAYPIADVALAFWRRGWRWSQPDRLHLHHRLLAIMAQRPAVARFYLITLVSTWLALLI